MKIPILTYRPMHMAGDDYRSNDLRALASDLRQINAAGFKVLPLRTIVDAWLDNRGHELDGRIVALASEDGADLDYRDLTLPAIGPQRSIFNILRDFAASERGQDSLNVTSFVIASPEARAILDTTALSGKGWWKDDWWAEAARSGLMHIANNSWDHNHETLPASMRPPVLPTTFLGIDSRESADHEIRRAADFLKAHIPNPGTALFAYPYGEGNAYLTREYLPAHADELGIRAAFTGRPGFLEPGTDRWEVPRFVCRRDWSSPAGLQEILETAADARRRWTPVRRPAQPPSPSEPAPTGNALRDFESFFATRIEPISGWLVPEAAFLTAHLASAQRARDIHGPTLEIGVYHGKYLSVLYRLSRQDEPVVGVDFFSGNEDASRDIELVRSNIASACGDASRLRIIVADSLHLNADKVSELAGTSQFRFISIDGGHTREIVCQDLATCYPLLRTGGIIALDDVFNNGTPGVVEGVAAFFLEHKPRLAPFAICYNKVFVTTPDMHGYFLQASMDFLERVPWLPTYQRTLERVKENREINFKLEMFGYEVLSFL